MRYSSALVLSTLAVGQAAAGNVRHASFHARRSESKRDMAAVNWDTVAYDLNNVDWNTVKYGEGQASATPAPAAPAVTSQPEVEPQPPKETKAAEPEKPKADPTSAQAPAETAKAKDNSNPIGDIFSGVEQFASALGVKAGLNAKAANGAIWIGDSGSDYKATFTNEGDSPVAVICWNAQGMWINANQPQIFVSLDGGASTTISIAEGFSGGCGAAASDSDLTNGLLNESILEFTAKPNENGCFDISREINMKGLVLTAKGSKCTTGVVGDQLSCVFGCVGGATQCGKGQSETGTGAADYNIALGAASEGMCMVGKDPYTGDPSGGCQMGQGEHMQVTIGANRDWPSGTEF